MDLKPFDESLKYQNRCGYKVKDGNLGHYGGLNKLMNERSKSVNKILESALDQIDVKLNEEFKNAMLSSTIDINSIGQREMLEMKHVIRL